ncbi:gluconate 2-dehydrogenase subunit 3 family protein [Xanthobacteraceae bacterium Astr-EGSB]|uniref:gluconate 2-dehydrogenase subunit 3 family protein n=1 Tax=Astrobacterium formosum TaxID=3069710 RepID=UPI0027B0ECEE|nr:gluconate 2-dehydrogenase subunit 3 family protein [Xanthobacteraceae bacterium Astr-EGSB]
MTEIARRELLQGASALGLAFALGSHASAQTQAAGQGSVYLFFTETEAQFIEAAVERLIPSEPEWPGARAVGVPYYIDLQLAGPYGRGDRLYLRGPFAVGLPGQGYQLALTPAQLYRTSLAAIAREFGPSTPFASLTDADKDRFLRRLEAGELTIDGFSSAIFFETLLANTIEGYFADPAYGGNRDMASWRMIGFPGAFAAYAAVYTRHGLKFDRAPMAMAEVAHHDDHHAAPATAGAAR